MNIFQKFFAYLRLREAVRKADEAHRSTGVRYYVMPSFGDGRKLLIIDRSNFRILKRKGYINNNAFTHDLLVESFYFTPHRDGSGWISDSIRRRKILQYFSWYNAELKRAKTYKAKRHGSIQRKS